MKQLPPNLADYIPVKERIRDFRNEHPDWSIKPTVELRDGWYVARCTIRDDQGRHIASAGALEKATKAFDYEKAETSAVGRALVNAGWVDSVDLSREEQERSVQVQTFTKQASPGNVERVMPRIKPPPAPEYQIDGLDEPPTEPRDPQLQVETVEAARSVDYLVKYPPVASAPKPIWSSWVAELVAACAAEHIDMDWKILAAGKGFNDLTSDELKQLATRAREILK